MARKLIIEFEFSQNEFEINNWFNIKLAYWLGEDRNKVVSSCVFYEGAIKSIEALFIIEIKKKYGN